MNTNNMILNTDGYKPSHWLQYPPGSEYVFSYVESRGGQFDATTFIGLQVFLKEVLAKPVTVEDVEEAKTFYEAYGTPFNYDGWMRLIEKHDGYLPIEIKAVPEGMTIPVSNVLASVVNTDPEFFWITSYIETALLRAIWYPTTVATNSREIKKIINQYLVETGDPAGIDFKLHDFGARGVSSFESAGIGGMSHLVNFMGSDTITGILYAQKYYGAEQPAFSIPAAEHSTMTSWGGREGEEDAMRNMLTQFGSEGSIVAVVSDSYDIYNAVRNLWGDKLKQEVIDSGATIVVRPDSGDPATVVRKIISILAEQFGTTTNDKGYKVLPDCIRVLQGDGINIDSIKEILYGLKIDGYSADNIAFGMGGAMLQHMDRDTQKFAMKASAICVDGKWRDVFKDPVTDTVKKSKKGRLTLYKATAKGIDRYMTDRTGARWSNYPRTEVLETVFLNGKITKEYTFDEVRKNARL